MGEELFEYVAVLLLLLLLLLLLVLLLLLLYMFVCCYCCYCCWCICLYVVVIVIVAGVYVCMLLLLLLCIIRQVYDTCQTHMDRKSNEFNDDAIDPQSPFIMVSIPYTVCMYLLLLFLSLLMINSNQQSTNRFNKCGTIVVN